MSSSGERERKVGLSCAECRRSKLKCDRVFPCQSCIRRGCGHLCPDGTLTATKGNRVLMAHAQTLAEQLKSANARIKVLEDALSKAQTGGEGQHPLLQGAAAKNADDTDTSVLKTIYDDDIHEVSDAIGSLSIGLDGKARYHGETAGSEYLHRLIDLPPDEDLNEETQQYLGMPFEIMDLVNAFPMGLKDCPYSKCQFVSFLPSRERAIELADLYYKNVAWMYDPIVRSDFMNTIISPIYGATGFASVDTIHSHKLSVFFIAMASGVLCDSHPSASILAQQYHALSRAALSFDSILQEANCATVQSLFMIIRFKYMSDSRGEERWLLGGICGRVAQIIGLQRDSAGWNLDPDEVQRRRILFWELYTHDAWSSVVHGRPPALSIQHTDCRFPDDLDPFVKHSGEVELGFHAWKFRYSASCLSVAVQHVFSTRAPSYSALLQVDKKSRQFPVPAHLQSPIEGSESGRAWSSNPTRAHQQYCVVCERESMLLYIHRSSFAQAIRAQPLDPLTHTFAPSVLATYRSACRLISSLKGLYAVHPDLCSRQWFFWSGIYSSCIVLGALVVESTGCTLAQNALQEMEQAVPFYEEGSRPCRPPATLAMLQKLLKRAQTSFAAFHAGYPHDNTLTSRSKSDEPDELEILGGRKSVITSKSSSNSPASNPAASSDQQQPFSGDTQSGPHQYDEVPPSLLDYYNTLGHPRMGTQVSGDFDMTPSSFVAPASGYGYAQGMLGAVQPPFQQAYTSGHYLPQQGMYMQASIHQPQQLAPIDITMANERTQDDIWQDFMGHLGLTRPIDE